MPAYGERMGKGVKNPVMIECLQASIFCYIAHRGDVSLQTVPDNTETA